MRSGVSRLVSAAFTSRTARDFRRARNRRPGPPVIDYFHQVDDPYSHLAAQVLAPLAARYGAAIRPWLVPPPEDSAAPERERLRAFGVRDAAVVASEYGLSFPAGAALPAAEAMLDAASALASHLRTADFAARAVAVGQALWTGADLPRGRTDPAADLAAGAAERLRLGHYLGAMFHFEREWYWGVDRLNHLEERLAARGCDTAPAATPPIAPWSDVALDGAPGPGSRPVIEFWVSFRSPYTWIAFPRVRRLAQHYGAELRLRYILPMVMRGLPIPTVKRLYIMLDTKREAERAGLPFGRAVDPVGRGAERALAVAHFANSIGLGEEFSERSLRDAAEINRAALFEAGLWGAPTYRVDGGAAHWSQDRLRALEADLKRAIES